jgi:C-terminal processing protease CtpA/Prc
MDLMEAHSINRRVIDWSVFRNRVFAEAGAAQTISDTEGAILVALGLLGDGHSLFVTAKGAPLTNYPRGDCTRPSASSPRLPPGIGYVSVGEFEGSGTAATQFARSIQDAISTADGLQIQGWIVDLRGNFGGNMWPMIAGIGPILGEGVCGYFIDPDGVEEAWQYSAGESLVVGLSQVRVVRPYRLLRDRPRVAVITGPTASAGEAVVVAFRARAGTRSFGGPTCGQSTANKRYEMSDGAALYLTTSVMADRTKTRYGVAIQPDETILDAAAVVERAVQWLLAP